MIPVISDRHPVPPTLSTVSTVAPRRRPVGVAGRRAARRVLRLAPAVGVAVVLVATGSSGPVAAHTEADLVAVPAGSEATVTFRPTHGCGDSPTIEVRVRVPVAEASAKPVEGWTQAAEPGDDPDASTVLTWSGGSLPADQVGAFPLEFTVPDEPGVLLTFPAIQRCADGQELAWISGDPTSPTPAPRLLVLPAGSPPAASIDEVAVDAPGRDQLVAIVDIDGPGATSVPTIDEPAATVAPVTDPPEATVLPATAEPGTAEPETTEPTAPATAAPVVVEGDDPGAADTTTGSTGDAADDTNDGGGGISPVVVVLVVVTLVAIGAGIAVLVRRRSAAG